MNFFKDQNLLKVIANTLSQIIVRFSKSFSTLLVTLIISYFLGFQVFGSFTKIITFASFFYLLADFGINTIFIKKFQENSAENLNNLILLRILLSVFLIFVIISITFFLPYNEIENTGFSSFERIGIILYSLTVVTQSLVFSLNAFLQKNLVYHYSIFPSIISSIVLLLFVVFGTAFKNLYIILFAYFISGFILFLLTYQKIKKKFVIKFIFPNFKIFSKKMMISSFPLALILILNLAHSKADVMILSFLKPNFDVGAYGFAYRFFEFMIAISFFVSNSIYPILVKNENNSEVFIQIIKRYTSLLLLLSFVIAFCAIIFSPLISLLKFDFKYSVLPVQILSLSLPFFFLTGFYQWIMVIKNKTYQLTFIYFAAMIVNILLNIILIPQYGYIGSSFITIFSEGLVFALLLIYVISLFRKSV